KADPHAEYRFIETPHRPTSWADVPVSVKQVTLQPPPAPVTPEEQVPEIRASQPKKELEIKPLTSDSFIRDPQPKGETSHKPKRPKLFPRQIPPVVRMETMNPLDVRPISASAPPAQPPPVKRNVVPEPGVEKRGASAQEEAESTSTRVAHARAEHAM